MPRAYHNSNTGYHSGGDMRTYHYTYTGLYTGFLPRGGRTWSMSKRGGARLSVAAGQPQGGGGFKGGARITQGGKMPPPPPAKSTPDIHERTITCIEHHTPQERKTRDKKRTTVINKKTL